MFHEYQVLKNVSWIYIEHLHNIISSWWSPVNSKLSPIVLAAEKNNGINLNHFYHC